MSKGLNPYGGRESMARNRKRKQAGTKRSSRAVPRSRRSRFMRNSAIVIAVLMATSLIGQTIYNKTTGHMSRPSTSQPQQPIPHHSTTKAQPRA
jgi:hypothetical protein